MSICNLPDGKYLFGGGGSKSIIILTEDERVFKVFPLFNYRQTNEEWMSKIKDQRNWFEMEIYINKMLTDKIIKKHRSPHIVELLDYGKCNTLPKKFFKDCDHIDDYLFKGKQIPEKKDDNDPLIKRPCSYLFNPVNIKLHKGYYVMELEHCEYSLETYIQYLLTKSKKELKLRLDRILFQMLFTIEVIKKYFPEFIHGDLFMRNILATKKRDRLNRFVRYKFNNNIFDIPSPGVYLKINDFGYTQLNDKSINFLKDTRFKKNEYRDWFFLLLEIYNALNKASSSELKKKFLENYFNNFFDLKLFKKLNEKLKSISSTTVRGLIYQGYFDLSKKKFRDLIGFKLPNEVFKYFHSVFKPDEDHIIIDKYNYE